MNYKVGDVVIVDLKEAREKVWYDGPAIVTIIKIEQKSNTYTRLTFKETLQTCGTKHLIGLATPLLKELF